MGMVQTFAERTEVRTTATCGDRNALGCARSSLIRIGANLSSSHRGIRITADRQLTTIGNRLGERELIRSLSPRAIRSSQREIVSTRRQLSLSIVECF